MDVLDDHKIIKLIQMGDKDRLDELIRKYYEEIYCFCYRKTGDASIATDITQEVFLKLVKYIHQYKHKTQFRNYLFTIAVNCCNDYFRKKGAYYADIDTIEICDVASDVNEIVLQEETAVLVKKAIDSLPDMQKDVVILRFYYDMKVKDIASITGNGLATTKSRLKQGLDKLKKLLGEEET